VEIRAAGMRWDGPPTPDAAGRLAVRAKLDVRAVGRWVLGPQSALDTASRLEWWRDASLLPAKWDDAGAACAADGWRLPTLRELAGLVQPGAGPANTDPEIFPRARPEVLWSATSTDTPGDIWAVSFVSGSPTHNARTEPYRFRCVRSSAP
jgi:hypothetical protein